MIKHIVTGIVIGCLSFSTFGQRKYNYSNTPKECIRVVYQKMEAEKLVPGKSGANIAWDFTEVRSTKDRVAKWVVKPDSLVKALFPEANLMEKYDDGTVFGLKTEYGRTYQVGYMNPKTGLKIEYPQALLLYRFPMNYRDVVARKYTSIFTLREHFFTGEGDVKIEVDGYGTLRMPDSVYKDVLRVRVTRDQEDFIEKYETSQKSTTTSYMWFDADSQYPILVLQKNNTGKKTQKEALYRKKLINREPKSALQHIWEED